jgi:GT2 family glycosyltransferase
MRPASFVRTREGPSVGSGTREATTADRMLHHVQSLTAATFEAAAEATSESDLDARATVSVIVPATNKPETLLRCCDALIASEDPPDEIVVVDSPGDANAATARNLGAERATGDILLFIDADVEVRPDAMSRIRAAFAGDSSLSAVFGSYDDSPAARGVVSSFRNLLHHHTHQSARGAASTFWTGLGAVRTDAFCKVGGFDEEIEFMEDVDLGMRLNTAGESIWLDPEIQGTHLKRWTVWSMIRTDVVGRGVPWIRILLRHRSTTTALNLGWRHRLSALAAVTFTLGLALLLPLVAAAALMLLVGLNWRFYLLLLRRRGPLETLAGVMLHVLHHLASVISIPIGIAFHLRDRRRARLAARAETENAVASLV